MKVLDSREDRPASLTAPQGPLCFGDGAKSLILGIRPNSSGPHDLRLAHRLCWKTERSISKEIKSKRDPPLACERQRERKRMAERELPMVRRTNQSAPMAQNIVAFGGLCALGSLCAAQGLPLIIEPDTPPSSALGEIQSASERQQGPASFSHGLLHAHAELPPFYMQLSSDRLSAFDHAEPIGHVQLFDAPAHSLITPTTSDQSAFTSERTLLGYSAINIAAAHPVVGFSDDDLQPRSLNAEPVGTERSNLGFFIPSPGAGVVLASGALALGTRRRR